MVEKKFMLRSYTQNVTFVSPGPVFNERFLKALLCFDGRAWTGKRRPRSVTHMTSRLVSRVQGSKSSQNGR